MNSWWFKLYTLPFLKKASLYFFGSLLLDIVLSQSQFYSSFVVFFVPFFSLIMKISPGSFRYNLEFHKSHVNYVELRKYFLFDVFISNSFFVTSLFLSIYLSKNLGGSFSKNPALVFWEMPNGSYFYYFVSLFVFLVWTSFLSSDGTYSFLGLKNRSSFKKVFLLLSLWILGLILIVLFGVFSFQLDLSNYFLITSICLGTIFFYLRAIFHKIPDRSTILQIFGHNVLGLILTSLLYVLSFFIFENDLMKPEKSKLTRINYYEFYAPLISQINQETFFLLEKNLSSYDISSMYKKVDFNVSKLRLNYFLDQSKDQSRLLYFLKYGKPDKEFLNDLLSDIDDRPEFWNKVRSTNKVLYLTFSKWPKNLKIPPSKISFKLKADEFAESLKRKKERRSPSNSRR